MGNSWSVLHASKCPLVTAVGKGVALWYHGAISGGGCGIDGYWGGMTHTFRYLTGLKNWESHYLNESAVRRVLGKLGPGQLASEPNCLGLSCPGPSCPGPNCPDSGLQSPICQRPLVIQWAPDSWALEPSCPEPICPPEK